MLCNGKKQKSPETRSGLGLAPSRFTSLHNIRYGILHRSLQPRGACASHESERPRPLTEGEHRLVASKRSALLRLHRSPDHADWSATAASLLPVETIAHLRIGRLSEG